MDDNGDRPVSLQCFSFSSSIRSDRSISHRWDLTILNNQMKRALPLGSAIERVASMVVRLRFSLIGQLLSSSRKNIRSAEKRERSMDEKEMLVFVRLLFPSILRWYLVHWTGRISPEIPFVLPEFGRSSTHRFLSVPADEFGLSQDAFQVIEKNFVSITLQRIFYSSTERTGRRRKREAMKMTENCSSSLCRNEWTKRNVHPDHRWSFAMRWIDVEALLRLEFSMDKDLCDLHFPKDVTIGDIESSLEEKDTVDEHRSTFLRLMTLPFEEKFEWKSLVWSRWTCRWITRRYWSWAGGDRFHHWKNRAEGEGFLLHRSLVGMEMFVNSCDQKRTRRSRTNRRNQRRVSVAEEYLKEEWADHNDRESGRRKLTVQQRDQSMGQ